jgi:hypothetical protein
MRKRATVIFVAAFVLLSAVHFAADLGGSFMPAFSALCVLAFGVYTYLFQLELIRFNRLGHRPSLIVNRTELEQKRVIQIENREQRIAYDVYIGSFLVVEDTCDHVILYDEVQAFVAQDYPVVQSDILKPPFRANFVRDDETKYGGSLDTRIVRFLAARNGRPVILVIALRNLLQEPSEAVMFFFRASDFDRIEGAQWQSIHLPRATGLYQTALSVANECYDRESMRTRRSTEQP